MEIVDTATERTSHVICKMSCKSSKRGGKREGNTIKKIPDRPDDKVSKWSVGVRPWNTGVRSSRVRVSVWVRVAIGPSYVGPHSA